VSTFLCRSASPKANLPSARLTRPGTTEVALLSSIHELFPSSGIHPARPLPDSEESFVASMPLAAHVPSAWFLTTSTVCSELTVAGLLHPAARHGVRRVSSASLLPSPKTSQTNATRSPQR